MDGYKQKNAYIGTQGEWVHPSQVGFVPSTCDSLHHMIAWFLKEMVTWGDVATRPEVIEERRW